MSATSSVPRNGQAQLGKLVARGEPRRASTASTTVVRAGGAGRQCVDRHAQRVDPGIPHTGQEFVACPCQHEPCGGQPRDAVAARQARRPRRPPRRMPGQVAHDRVRHQRIVAEPADPHLLGARPVDGSQDRSPHRAAVVGRGLAAHGLHAGRSTAQMKVRWAPHVVQRRRRTGPGALPRPSTSVSFVPNLHAQISGSDR